MRIVIAVVSIFGSVQAIASEAEGFRSACIAAALEQLAVQISELRKRVHQKEPPVFRLEDVLARRRLEEDYCTRFVQCLELAPERQGSPFSRCLDGEAEERLRHETK